MIGRISAPRGEKVAGLIYYLYGPGRHEEHTDPHIVAGWRDPAELEPSVHGGRRDFRQLIGLLNQPHAAMGTWADPRPVWHCSMRTAPEDRMLSDQEWAQIARDVMNRTGLSRHGEEDDAVRWVAVRHGADHIHIVAMLARQDRRRASTSNDRYRVREACLAAERRYGLRSTAPADRTAARRPSRAENEKAARNRQIEAPRVTLRRHVATAAASAANEAEFFARLDQAGVLVRKRYSTRDPDQITGYTVAMPDHATATGGPIWYSGGKLAADLSWPRLSHRWASQRSPDRQLSADEVKGLWDDAARVASDATEQIRYWSGANPTAAADAAYAAGDTLRVTAAVLGSRVLQQAADDFDRAARSQFGRIPPPSPIGNRLRRAARLISAYGYITQDRTFTPLLLMIRLAALAEALADLRQIQQRAHQAGAALQAARHLDTARQEAWAASHGKTETREPATHPSASDAARLAAASFPDSPFPADGPNAIGSSRPYPTGPRSPAPQTPPRRRGPGRS